MTLKEKIVKRFESNEDASAFINGRWGGNGLIFTWSPLTGYNYSETPPRKVELTAEEVEMKKNLRNSFTIESVEEWGMAEMKSQVQENSKPHPEAKGYEDKK